MSEERKKILAMVESGQLSAEQAATLLDLVSEAGPEDAGLSNPDLPTFDAPGAEQVAVFPRQRYWLYPMAAGIVLVLLGGTVLAATYQLSRPSLATWLFGWMPLLLGLGTVTIAAWARTAHWFHLRVVNRANSISVSVPLPLRLTALLLRAVRPFVPQLRETAVDELILSLQEGLEDDQPMTIEVEGEEGEEHVRIHIG
jgi:hypothetical protein